MSSPSAGSSFALPEHLAPPAPPLATAVFRDRLALAIRFADLLVGPGIERGLLGPREAERIWVRHILNCAAIAPLLPEGDRAADLGSGAGLPGLVLAIARPDVHMTLVEPLQRRVAFLEEAVECLALPNVVVLRARAEEIGDRCAVTVVTARAVAPLNRLARLARPLLPSGGVLLALKGASAADEVARHDRVLRELGGREVEVLHIGDDVRTPAATVVRVEFAALRPSPPGRFSPRRAHRRKGAS